MDSNPYSAFCLFHVMGSRKAEGLWPFQLDRLLSSCGSPPPLPVFWVLEKVLWKVVKLFKLLWWDGKENQNFKMEMLPACLAAGRLLSIKKGRKKQKRELSIVSWTKNNMKRPTTQVRFLMSCSEYSLGINHRPHCYRTENLVLMGFVTLIT